MKRYILCENIRSAYNVGNIVRTADALQRGMVTTWYTAPPSSHPKVQKTALGAQDSIQLHEFSEPQHWLDRAREQWLTLLIAEDTSNAILLSDDEAMKNVHRDVRERWCVVIMGNEVEWVLIETIEQADYVLKIPMRGVKESLNVWQAAAILMWELGR